MDDDWNAAYRAAYRRAYAVLRNATRAEDVAQHACLKAFVKRASFQGRSSFPAWVAGIAYHLAIDLWHAGAADGPDPDAYPGPADPEAEAWTAALQRILVRCLGRLTEHQRGIFLMKHLEERKGDEVAHAYGVKSGTVWATLHQCAAKLRDCLAQHGVDGGALA